MTVASTLNILIPTAYLVAAILFIFGMKLLGSPATARIGNRLAALGMLIAIVATLGDRNIIDFRIIVVGIAIGSIFGIALAKTIAPERVSRLSSRPSGVPGSAENPGGRESGQP